MSHYSKGSPKPPPANGCLRLYSMRFCPFAQRTRLVLAAKGIKYDCVNINLKDKPEWFFELNPLGKVPVIETPDGKVLYESALCCEYLEDLYPEVALFPKDPFEKHRQRLLVETLGSKITGAVYKVHFQGTEDSKAELDKQLDVFDKELTNVGKTFLAGDNPGMADYLIWPWIERIVAFQTISGYDLSKFPAVSRWQDAMKDLPAVKECSTPAELHIKFTEAYRAGKSDSQLLGTQ